MLIILNGISRKRRKFYHEILPMLEEFQPSIEVTEYAGHARAIATAASLRGESLILSAGGDGTLSQVVNGVMSSGAKALPTLGIIPLGSGNDFARTFGLTASGRRTADLIRANKPRTIDVGVVELNDATHKVTSRFFINECSIGMGPEVVRRIGTGSRKLGPSITYLRAIITTFFTNRPQRVQLDSQHYSWKGDARVVAVANGKAFGHSLYIAPDAEPDDGLLNAFLCKGIPSLTFLTYLQRIKKPKKIEDLRWIEYRTLDSIRIQSEGAPLPVEADGELIGYTPMNCTLSKKALNLLV